MINSPMEDQYKTSIVQSKLCHIICFRWTFHTHIYDQYISIELIFHFWANWSCCVGLVIAPRVESKALGFENWVQSQHGATKLVRCYGIFPQNLAQIWTLNIYHPMETELFPSLWTRPRKRLIDSISILNVSIESSKVSELVSEHVSEHVSESLLDSYLCFLCFSIDYKWWIINIWNLC